MLFFKEIDYNEILVIKNLSLFYIYLSLICYFLVIIFFLCFKYNDVLLYLV